MIEVKDRTEAVTSLSRLRVEAGRLVMRRDDGDESEVGGWQDFVNMLREIDAENWCNLTLQKTISKQAAMDAGVAVADQVTDVWHALLPLYWASVHRA